MVGLVSRRRPLLVVVALVLALASVAACDTGRPALEFDPDALPPAKIGTAYQADIVVARNVTPVGGASTAPGTLPPGLTLELLAVGRDTVRIAGTPTAAGTYAVVIAATDAAGAGSATLTLTVA